MYVLQIWEFTTDLEQFASEVDHMVGIFLLSSKARKKESGFND